MKLNAIEQVTNARESSLRILKRDASNQPMHFISERQEILREVTAVLSGDARNESLQLFILPFGYDLK